MKQLFTLCCVIAAATAKEAGVFVGPLNKDVPRCDMERAWMEFYDRIDKYEAYMGSKVERRIPEGICSQTQSSPQQHIEVSKDSIQLTTPCGEQQQDKAPLRGAQYGQVSFLGTYLGGNMGVSAPDTCAATEEGQHPAEVSNIYWTPVLK